MFDDMAGRHSIEMVIGVVRVSQISLEDSQIEGFPSDTGGLWVWLYSLNVPSKSTHRRKKPAIPTPHV